MKRTPLLLIFLFVSLFVLAQDSTTSRHFFSREFNWSVDIPAGFKSVSDEEWKQTQARGAKTIEKAYDIQVENNTTTIFVFKDGPVNMFEANYQNFEGGDHGEYLERVNTVNQVLYGTFESQMKGARLDSGSAKEIIDGRAFHVFRCSIGIADRLNMTYLMYSTLVGKRDLTINMLSTSEEKLKGLQDALRRSSFSVMFDTSGINKRTRLMGVYPQYDKQKRYRNLNFLIEDPEAIKKAIALLRVGEEVENTIEEPGFDIRLIQDHEDKGSWWVNPGLGSAGTEGHTYTFDVSKLKLLAKQYPFDYRFEKVAFKTMQEYNQYLDKKKKDKLFLYANEPSFAYEGGFKVSFPRNATYSSPKAISDYLKPMIEKIVSKDKYSVSYELDDKNLKDQSQFTMTISGSRKLYDELKLDNLQKQAWEPSEAIGWFYYKLK